MAKLIICCDGTWNDQVSRTHIWRLSEAAGTLAPGNGYKVYYDRGVGTGRDEGSDDADDGPGGVRGFFVNMLDRVGGGAFGTGISRNIRQAYAWLAQTYRAGDEIYIFGFSRGAYTVRSLCGFIGYAGLLHKEDLGRARRHREFSEVEKAYRAYRTPDDIDRKTHPWLATEAAGRARRDVAIHFLGVFDTVGALGVPVGWIERARNWLAPEKSNSFHDTRLGADVKFACHALAVDERRGPYQPTLWTGAARPQQRVLQAWFAGVHSDVGGGYQEKSLANMALTWMLGEAAWAGLDLRPGFDPEDLEGSPAGKAHDSVTLGFRLAHWLPSIDFYRRPIGLAQRQSWFGGEPDPVPGESVHWSVVDRVEGEAARTLAARKARAYRPPSLVPSGDAGVKLTDVPIHGRDDTPVQDRAAS